MATAALISASEYLKASCEHDAEFVDGRIQERPVGERDHDLMQRKLLLILSARAFVTFSQSAFPRFGCSNPNCELFSVASWGT
jgi:hypothetical protein